jgi:hypothetical protein
LNALLAEMTQARDTAAAAEAAHVMAVLAVETSAREAAATQDSAALRVKDAEDRAVLAEREALERVLRVEVENATVLASAHEEAGGFVQKITLLEGELAAERWARVVSGRERREQFEKLTLLQTQGSKLCHTIIGPPWAPV